MVGRSHDGHDGQQDNGAGCAQAVAQRLVESPAFDRFLLRLFVQALAAVDRPQPEQGESQPLPVVSLACEDQASLEARPRSRIIALIGGDHAEVVQRRDAKYLLADGLGQVQRGFEPLAPRRGRP